jgi:hypothetical protein
MEHIATNAKKVASAEIDTSAPKAQRIKTIRKNRAEEKELHRQSEAFDLADPPVVHDAPIGPHAPNPALESNNASPMKLLRASRNQKSGERK